jgi:hypothetical protein
MPGDGCPVLKADVSINNPSFTRKHPLNQKEKKCTCVRGHVFLHKDGDSGR